jgi:hypothetical protein
MLCGCFLRTDDGNVFGNLPETDIPGCSRKPQVNMYYVIRDDGRDPYVEIVIDVVFDRGSDVSGCRLGRVKATIMLTHDEIASMNWKEVSFLQDSVSRMFRFRWYTVLTSRFLLFTDLPTEGFAISRTDERTGLEGHS